MILSIDFTRLALNSSNCYPLLGICGLRGCLIADRDGVYDPGSANGRLLLRQKGTKTELELHTLSASPSQCSRARVAERPEARFGTPAG